VCREDDDALWLISVILNASVEVHYRLHKLTFAITSFQSRGGIGIGALPVWRSLQTDGRAALSTIASEQAARSHATYHAFAGVVEIFRPEQGRMTMRKEEGRYAAVQACSIWEAVERLLPFCSGCKDS
jgi:hypothetical protein